MRAARFGLLVFALSALGALGASAPPAGQSAAPAPGDAVDGTPLRAAGSAEHGWILIEGRVRPGDGQGTRLYHLPHAAPPGTVVPVNSVAAATETAALPLAMAAWGPRVVMVYERPEGAEGATTLVRTVSVGAMLTQGLYQYEPPSRLGALAPVPESIAAGRAVESLADTPGGAAVLLRGDSDRAIAVLGREGWAPLEAPPGGDQARPWRLLKTARGLTAVELAVSPPSRAWTLENGSWKESRLAVSAADEEIVAADGVIVAVERVGNGAIELDLVRGASRHTLRRLESVPANHAAGAIGEAVFVAWFSQSDPARERLELAVVSAVTGRLLHGGTPVQFAPVRPRDFMLLGLLLAGVMLGVLVYVVRPAAAAKQTITLPEGTALAEPATRLFAALADYLPCILIAAKHAGVSPVQAFTMAFGSSGADGAWPFLVSLAIFFVYCAISEWIWGRTLGKVLLGCATASVTGRRPSLWQAVSRNAVKAIAPPVTLVVFFDPGRRHPGDMLAGTVVVSPVDAAPPAASGEGEGGG